MTLHISMWGAPVLLEGFHGRCCPLLEPDELRWAHLPHVARCCRILLAVVPSSQGAGVAVFAVGSDHFGSGPL